MKKKTLFLDRDGVINVDLMSYVTAPEDFKPIEGSLEAISKLNKSGYLVAIATNQACINKGIISDKELLGIHNFMSKLLEQYNGKIDLCIIANHDIACLNVAVKVLRKGGTILFFGEPRANSTIKLDMSLIYSKEIKIITSYSATNKDFFNAMKFISKNKINLKKFISHEFKIEDAVKGIKILLGAEFELPAWF